MTLREIISKVDEIKINAYSEEIKTGWINKVEGMVQAEIIGVPDAEIVVYTWEDNADDELLVKHPYSDVYEFYLYAMIDFFNKEIGSYQNSMVMFNNAYAEYSDYYNRVLKTAPDLYVKNIW